MNGNRNLSRVNMGSNGTGENGGYSYKPYDRRARWNNSPSKYQPNRTFIQRDGQGAPKAVDKINAPILTRGSNLEQLPTVSVDELEKMPHDEKVKMALDRMDPATKAAILKKAGGDIDRIVIQFYKTENGVDPIDDNGANKNRTQSQNSEFDDIEAEMARRSAKSAEVKPGENSSINTDNQSKINSQQEDDGQKNPSIQTVDRDEYTYDHRENRSAEKDKKLSVVDNLLKKAKRVGVYGMLIWQIVQGVGGLGSAKQVFAATKEAYAVTAEANAGGENKQATMSEEDRVKLQKEIDAMYAAPETSASQLKNEVKGSVEAILDSIKSGKANFLNDDAIRKNISESLTNVAERLTNHKMVKLANGESVLVDMTLGGDNTGQDILDVGNKKGEVSLSTRDPEFANEMTAWTKANESPEAFKEFQGRCLGELNRTAANLMPLVQELNRYGEYGEAPNEDEHYLDKMVAHYQNDPAAYALAVGKLTFYKMNDESRHEIFGHTKKYISDFCETIEKKNEDGSISYSFHFGHDKSVTPKDGLVLIDRMTDEHGVNIFEKPENLDMKIRVLKMLGIEDAETNHASYIILGREVSCKQYAAMKIEVTPGGGSSITTKEYGGGGSSSTHGERHPGGGGGNKITTTHEENGGGGGGTEITTTHEENGGGDNGGNNHEDSSGKKDDDKKPKSNPNNNPGDNPGGKPVDKPKDNEVTLDAKTGDVRGALQGDDAMNLSQTDQTMNFKQGGEDDDATHEGAGAAIQADDLSASSVKEVFEESGKQDEDDGRTYDGATTNEDLKTGADEKQRDSEAKQEFNDVSSEDLVNAEVESYKEGAMDEFDFSKF
jgi:hypothetical protein